MSPKIVKQFVLAEAGLPALGPEPRAGVWAESKVNSQLASCKSLSDKRVELVRALVLLWHDHLDAAHVIAQEIDTPDGAFVHGIVHRREPDYWNSKYWFRRVGSHPAFGQFAERVIALLQAKGETKLATELAPNGVWDPFKFVDLCEEAQTSGSNEARRAILRELQGIEMETLLEWLQS